MPEKLQIDYDYLIEYLITPLNAVGSTTDITLRTVTTHNDANTKYVRKFGTDYLITQVTDIEDPIDANMTFTVKALDGTVLGSRVGGGAFSAGATVTAQGCKLEVSASGGAVTVLTGITIDTDVDAGGLAFVCAAESVADGDTLTLYLSDTSSTYYDENYMYGGGRHTESGLTRLPYFHPTAAIAALGGAHTIVTVLDSATYELKNLTISGAYILQAALGETPTSTGGIGARDYHDITNAIGNNANTIYVSFAGSDSTGAGTYQSPYRTIQYCENNMTTRERIGIMDSENYQEELTINAATTIILEPLYGKTPSITGVDGGGTTLITVNTNSTIVILNLTIDGSKGYTNGVITSANTFVRNCTIKYFVTCIITDVLQAALSNIEWCDISEATTGIYIYWDNASPTVDIKYCKIYNCTNGIHMSPQDAGSQNNIFIDILHCIIYNNTTGIFYQNQYDALTIFASGGISNCIITKNDKGIDTEESGINGWIRLSSGTYPNNIIYNNTTFDVDKANNSFQGTLTNSNYGTSNNWTIGAGNITTDPYFIDSDNNKFGLSFDLSNNSWSGAFRTGNDSNDMGVHDSFWNLLLIDNSDITINGFIFDGQNECFKAIVQIGDSSYTGINIKWCTIQNFYGAAIDIHDVANTDYDILNNILYNNGNGSKFSYGGNEVAECIIYDSIAAGLFVDNIQNSISHCTLYGNSVGVYNESNGAGLTTKNSIFHKNSANDIYSEIGIVMSYSSSTGSRNNVTDFSTNNNVGSNPLFVNETIGSEDFHLKALARKDPKDSPCLNGADDDDGAGNIFDMGAYLETRAISDEARKKYVFDTNPRNLNVAQLAKGSSKTENIFGSLFTYTKDFRKLLPFEWAADSYMTDEQWRKIRYLASLWPSRHNKKTRDECLVRVKMFPAEGWDSGSGIISGLGLTDSSKDWVEDTWRGLWVAIKYYEFATSTVDATDKVVTVAGAAFDDGEHDGYYLRYDGYDMLITDTLIGNKLYLSDPRGVLVDGTLANSFVLDNYRIDNNAETGLTLLDPYLTLKDGTYNYYIDFFECIASSPRNQYKQPVYNPANGNWKTGFNIAYEES